MNMVKEVQACIARQSEFSWGPKMTGQSVALWGPNPANAGKTYNMAAQPDNYKDFYSTGSQISNSIAFSGGGEKTQTYFSYTNVGATGIVDNNKLKRNNVNLRISSQIKLANALSLRYKNDVFERKNRQSSANR